MKTQHSFLFALAVTGLLAGCGGGGDDGGAVAPPPTASLGASPTCTGAEVASAFADATVAVGKAAGAVIAGCTGPISDVQWTQASNGAPAVTLMSAKTQAISFEPPVAGTYRFTVSFRDALGARRSADVSTVVTAPSAPVVVRARVDQAVRQGGKVSLRAWPAAAAGETITWTQTAGPQVTLDTGDPNRALFTAPEVARDTTLVFRVTKRTAAGDTDADDVLVLVENYAQAPADPNNTGPYAFSDTHVSRVYAYRSAADGNPFADQLVRCTYDAGLQYIGMAANACPLSTLPFLHQTSGGAVPTVRQIMERVVASHDWMGDVFERFLTTQATDDIKRLLNGVTAIVIGAHVRPSFYYAATGAIYLDADNFWLTAEQRDVIDESPDFRSDFDRDLIYSSAWRYTSTTDGAAQSIFVNFPETSRIARDLGYLLAEAGWLLYHELGHASDFLPPAVRGSLDSNLSAWGNISPRFQARTLPSDDLSRTLPLQSPEMFGLAQVKFQGATATAGQRAYTPDAVASFFAADRASDEYNYSTTREDAAMLFEEFMMFRNHGWRRDMAFTDKITSGATGSSLVVRWGRRGRIGEAAVKPRAQLVVGHLAPWVLSTDPNAVQNLPAPIPMRAGDSWTSNLTLPAPLGGLAGIQSLRAPLDFESERAMLLRDLTRHRSGTPNDRFLRRLGR